MKKKHLLSFLLLASLQASAQTPPPTVAVSDFDARGLSKDNALVISDQLRSELLNTHTFEVIERSAMEQVLKEQGFQQGGCTSDECAVEAGQLLGVKYFVVGSLGAAGSYTILSSRIIDVATGRILVNRTVKNKGGVDAMIESGVLEMAKALSQDYQTAAGMNVEPSTARNGETSATDVSGTSEIQANEATAADLKQSDKAAGADVPEKSQKKTADADHASKKHSGPVVGAIVGGAAVVGGAVALIVILGGKSESADAGSDQGNTTFELPQ